MSKVHDALSQAFKGQYTLTLSLDVNAPHKYIVLSDQHKGARNKADEFRKCEAAYRAALTRYEHQRFALILLGDVEELWEERFKSVRKAYRDVLVLEGSFPATRYFRVWGNHDDYWMRDKNVRKRLQPLMPVGTVYEAIRFFVTDDGADIGKLFLIHGHQGTFASDKIRGLSRLFLRVIWRPLQRLTKIGRQTPAKDACLRGEHDQKMYNWATKQDKLVLIAGHTHRPVWSSKTHLQKLQDELATLQAAPRPDDPNYQQQVDELEEKIRERAEKAGDCKDTLKPIPCYFNTGCCKFDDGDITGIEIEDGTMRLIKWSKEGQRTLLEQGTLSDIFEALVDACL